jgi:hypothetical protein
MKTFLCTAALLLTAWPAFADAIVMTATVDGSLVNTSTSADGTLDVTNQSFGPVFNLNSLSINSEQFLGPGEILSTNTLDVNQLIGGTHQLVIDIKATGLAGPGALTNLLSSFSVTGQAAGWTAQEETLINGLALANTGVFSVVSDSAFSVNPAFLTNPFAAEVIYSINSIGSGRFNGGIDIDLAAVPGPIVGAGLPGLLAGGVALLGWYRRRKLVAKPGRRSWPNEPATLPAH